MCGLVGMAGDITAKERKIFKDMLDVCQLRGRDSTGVIRVNRTDYSWVKRVGPPAFLFDSKQYDDVVETGGLPKVLIGHCRHKTVGGVSNKTAHPFDFPDEGICGVHNGTLRSYQQLDGYKYDLVDSEVLYSHLAKNGPEETFNKVRGAYACVWWDDNEQRVKFIRNDERPLYFTYSKDYRIMFWASEIWMFAAVSRKMDLWEPKEGQPQFIELPIHTLWSFGVDPNVAKGKSPFTMDPVLKIEPPKVEVRSNSGKGSSGSWRGPYSYGYGGTIDEDDWDWDDNLQSYVRTPEEKKKKGGEVPRPFQGESKSTENSAKKSSTTSQNSSVPSTHGTSTTKPSKAIVSVPSSNSNDSQKTNKRNSSNDSEKRNTLSLRAKPNTVSIRNVLGNVYITNNTTGKEYSEKEFDEKTKGVCCHCKEPIGDLTEVEEIFDEHRFICKTCVNPRKEVRKVA